jgi:hypothetical protein
VDINEVVNRLFEQERACQKELTPWPLMNWKPSSEQYTLKGVSTQNQSDERKAKSPV